MDKAARLSFDIRRFICKPALGVGVGRERLPQMSCMQVDNAWKGSLIINPMPTQKISTVCDKKQQSYRSTGSRHQQNCLECSGFKRKTNKTLP